MKTRTICIALFLSLAFIRAFASPSVVTSDTIIKFPYTLIGAASVQRSYTISGKDLKESILIMAPLGYKVSLTSGADFTSSITLIPQNGIVAPTVVYIKYMPKSKECNNGTITNTSYTVIKSVRVQAPVYYALSFRLSSGGYSDETIVRFLDPATLKFDSNYDISKMMNSGNTPSVFTSCSNVNLAINSYPISAVKNISMALNTDVKFEGTYKLELLGIESFDPSISIYIYDRETNRIYNYRDALAYELVISPASTNRFVLYFVDNNNTMNLNAEFASNNIVTGLSEDLSANDSDFIQNRDGKISIDETKLLPLTNMHLEVYNMNGQRIFTEDYITSNSEENYQLKTTNLSNGIYIINAVYQNKVIQKKVYLN